jgi:protein-tyrosine phosphatase
MDDGSANLAESIAMLERQAQQGVKTVIATPHFYANEESIESFLQRRKNAYGLLSQSLKEAHPHVFCGADVRYYPGISKLENLGALAIEGTRMLLLEMPMVKWTEYTVKELIELAGTRGLTVVMAHIERYLALQGKAVFERLRRNGLLMQVNASLFERIGGRHKGLKLLSSGMVQFIGSDCHNLTTRAPSLGGAYEYVERKFGKDFVDQMNDFGYRALGQK